MYKEHSKIMDFWKNITENFIYTVEYEQLVNNFESDTVASGDDVFLLHSIKAKYPKAITFAKEEDAIVMTHAEQSIKAVINQRKRWTAKSANYKDFASIYTSSLVLVTNLIGVFLLSLLPKDL